MEKGVPTSLRESHKGADPTKQNIRVGIRAAKIRTANGKTNRPVTKLFPVEVNNVSESSVNARDGDSDKRGDDEDTLTTIRASIGEQLTRKATVRARNHIKG